LRRDTDVDDVVAAPGNPGMAEIGRCVPVNLGSPDDVLELARQERADLTVVGPEAPLERGLGDLFRKQGRPIVGPSRAGAALECSKVHAKQFMARHGIPTADFVVCTEIEDALEVVLGARFGFPVVVKADGLAAGKGVVVAQDRAEAEGAVRAAMMDRRFGAAGSRLVIEECMTGPEVSFFVLSNGNEAVQLSTAQDHKRIFDGDRGPNTGGMGAFAPSPLMSDRTADLVMQRIVYPVLEGMRREGEPYCGFLYVGLMLTVDGPKVVEFNVRFGDPEAQVVLPQIEGPFATVLLASATGGRLETGLGQSTDRLVGVVMASRGYPETSEAGRPISGLDRAARIANALVFQASTRVVDGRLETAGGRVLTVVGHGPTYERAMETAYQAVGEIHFDGMQFRRDIGRKALVGAAEARR
jgi:phosphoribosylamine--glycine ligase